MRLNGFTTSFIKDMMIIFLLRTNNVLMQEEEDNEKRNIIESHNIIHQRYDQSIIFDDNPFGSMGMILYFHSSCRSGMRT